MDEDGRRLFSPGDAATLRNEVRDNDLQKLMLAVLSSEEEGEELDMKALEKSLRKTTGSSSLWRSQGTGLHPYPFMDRGHSGEIILWSAYFGYLNKQQQQAMKDAKAASAKVVQGMRIERGWHFGADINLTMTTTQAGEKLPSSKNSWTVYRTPETKSRK